MACCCIVVCKGKEQFLWLHIELFVSLQFGGGLLFLYFQFSFWDEWEVLCAFWDQTSLPCCSSVVFCFLCILCCLFQFWSKICVLQTVGGSQFVFTIIRNCLAVSEHHFLVFHFKIGGFVDLLMLNLRIILKHVFSGHPLLRYLKWWNLSWIPRSLVSLKQSRVLNNEALFVFYWYVHKLQAGHGCGSNNNPLFIDLYMTIFELFGSIEVFVTRLKIRNLYWVLFQVGTFSKYTYWSWSKVQKPSRGVVGKYTMNCLRVQRFKSSL